ncbi:MAG TPA: rhodanese-like domain-containing protein [Aestuariivirga sp.]|nr:rhodanese-like domain-containing protein [Aestuariivirga sp.]
MPTRPPARNITPRQTAHYMKRGAVLVDIREAYEHNAEYINGDRLHPLSALPTHIDSAGKTVIFYCQHGNRTDDEAERLGQIVDGKALLLGGGIEAWKQAGLPIVGDEKGAAGALLLRKLLGALDKAKG